MLVKSAIAANKIATSPILSQKAFQMSGLAPLNIQPVLSSKYVLFSHRDQELLEKQQHQGRFHISSSILNSDYMIEQLNDRGLATVEITSPNVCFSLFGCA